MRSVILAAVAGAALLAGCGMGGPQYPQFTEAAYRIEGLATAADGGAASRTVIYRDGPRMRVEATLPTMGPATIVFDESTNAAYVLNPTTAAPVQQNVVPNQPATPGAASPSTTTATPPAPAAPVATGVAVRIQDTDAPQPLEAAWAALGADNARRIGACEVAGESGNDWSPRAESAGVERVACITEDGIVLRISESGRVLWEATSLQRGEQAAALFGVPAGYQLIDPQAVAAEVGENMEQLDSVTGAPPVPQQAPAPRG